MGVDWIEDGHVGIVTLEWVVKVDCDRTRGGAHNIEMKKLDDGASPDGFGDDDGEPTGRCWVVVQRWNTKWWQRLAKMIGLGFEQTSLYKMKLLLTVD